MNKLDEIRAKLRTLESRRTNTFTVSDNYPFWNLDIGKSVRIRFLPDANVDNTFFWAEKNVIKLTFPGIEGQINMSGKEVVVQVPCMEMYGETCPIITETRPWWNDASLESLARKYWKKKTYIFQGLIQGEDPLPVEDSLENPIRRFSMGPQIFNIIKSALLDPDFENIPTDLTNGTDFTIEKGQKGEWADYTTSKWARKESALNDEQLQAIKEYGLKNLSDYLPNKPSPEHLSIIFEMFEASVQGGMYEPSKWAKYYRPYGLEYDDHASAPSAEKPTSNPENGNSITDASSAEDKKETHITPAGSDIASKSASDILDMIRARNATGA